MSRALRRQAVLFLIAVGAALSLSACGGGEGSSSTSAKATGEGNPTAESSTGVVADGAAKPGYIHPSSIGNEPLEKAELTAYFVGQLESQTADEWNLRCFQYEKPHPSERLYLCSGTATESNGLSSVGAYLWGIDQSSGQMIPIKPIEVGRGFPYSGPVEVGPNGELIPKPEAE